MEAVTWDMSDVRFTKFYVTDFGAVMLSDQEAIEAGATFKKSGLPRNKNARILHDFLTYYAAVETYGNCATMVGQREFTSYFLDD